MAISHFNSIALSGVSHLNGIAKSGLSEIGGQALPSAGPTLEDITFVDGQVTPVGTVWTGSFGGEQYERSDRFLAAGDDGYISIANSNSNTKSWFGFKTTNTNGNANTFLVAIRQETAAILSMENGTETTDFGGGLSDDIEYRLVRTGSVLTMVSIRAGGTPSLRKTYTVTSSGDLYVCATFTQFATPVPKVHTPKIYNGTLI